MTLRERLQSIVIEKFMGDKVSILETTDAILFAIKEAMPDVVDAGEFTYAIGWNACLEEMEKRCE